jgi:hypothetical protein
MAVVKEENQMILREDKIVSLIKDWANVHSCRSQGINCEPHVSRSILQDAQDICVKAKLAVK